MVEKETVDQLLTETPQEVPQEAQQEEVVQAQQVDKSQQQKENFRRLKEEKEKAERERDELMRLLAIQQQHASSKQQVQEDDDADELVDKRSLSKKLKEQEQRISTQLDDLRIRAQYPDWDKVVNEENAARLKSEAPQVFKMIQESQDYYSKAVSAYTIIKKLNLDADEDTSGVISDRQRLALNATKPKLAATISPSAPSKGLAATAADDNKLTPELAAKYYQEMQKSRKGYFS